MPPGRPSWRPSRRGRTRAPRTAPGRPGASPAPHRRAAPPGPTAGGRDRGRGAAVALGADGTTRRATTRHHSRAVATIDRRRSGASVRRPISFSARGESWVHARRCALSRRPARRGARTSSAFVEDRCGVELVGDGWDAQDTDVGNHRRAGHGDHRAGRASAHPPPRRPLDKRRMRERAAPAALRRSYRVQRRIAWLLRLQGQPVAASPAMSTTASSGSGRTSTDVTRAPAMGVLVASSSCLGP